MVLELSRGVRCLNGYHEAFIWVCPEHPRVRDFWKKVMRVREILFVHTQGVAYLTLGGALLPW